MTRFGFKRIAYSGLETGSREVASHVLQHGEIIFVLCSPIVPSGCKAMKDHMGVHGDAVKDVAFRVDDACGVYEAAVANGAKSIKAPWTEKDGDGFVKLAIIHTFGDTVRTSGQDGLPVLTPREDAHPRRAQELPRSLPPRLQCGDGS